MILVLASSSPRRCALLKKAGIAFEVAPVEIDEDLARTRPGASAAEAACELALRKALARARLVPPRPGGAVVLGADTIVLAPSGQALGKPGDADDARRMASGLAGCEHRVVTGVALTTVPEGRSLARAVESAVRFRPLAAPAIEAYVASGLWRGKAGGYGLQDDPPGGRALVAEVRGSETNVIGLPVEETLAMLDEVAGS